MNKTYKYTLSSGEKKEITFDVGVNRLAISNANGEDGGSGVVYTAGNNIQISEENVISAIDTTYTAGSGIEISEQNVISNTAEGNTDIIAEEYDNAKSYAVGDYCIYDNKLYKCISAITPPYWYKIPIKFSDFLNFSNVSAIPEDCYVTVQTNGHWIMASTAQNQTIRNIGFSQNYSLIYAYSGTASTGYYNGFDYDVPSVIAQYFPNGGYASESAALADLFSRPYFDVSKWTEVTVGDELKNIKEDISIINITTTESLAGFKYNGKDVYVKELIFSNVNQNTSYTENFDAVDIVKFDGHATDESSGQVWFYNVMDYKPGYNRAFTPHKVNVSGPDGRSPSRVHLFVYYTKIEQGE